ALLAQQGAVLATLWVTHHRTDAVGAVNVYSYVQAVYLLPYAVLAVPIATSAFPALAHTAAAESADAELLPGTAARDTLARSLRGILLLVSGAAAVLMAVAQPVGEFFHSIDPGARGATPGTRGSGADALAALPGALSAYAPGVVGFAVAALLTRALYVRGRPLYAALAVAAGWAVTALGPIALLPEGSSAASTLGVLGVSSTVGMTLSAAVLALLVRQAWGPEALAGSGRTLGTALVGVAVGFGVGDAVARSMQPQGVVSSLAVGVAVAILTGLSYLLVMAVGDRRSVQALRERGRRRRRGGAE
ncbi:MAG: lipid II flippase MurJ, partial [Angustibacter sp.]